MAHYSSSNSLADRLKRRAGLCLLPGVGLLPCDPPWLTFVYEIHDSWPV